MRDLIGLLLAILLVFLFGFNTGTRTDRKYMFNRYCESLSGIYEQVDDIDYCIVDNQLQEIEWVK